MSRHPLVKWAQRRDTVFITLELPDAQDVKLKLEPEGKFCFSATSGPDKIPYEIELDLLDEVNVDESKALIGARNVCYLVKMARYKWWNRLLKHKGKSPVFLSIDWDKWMDEDEEFARRWRAPPELEDFDFSDLRVADGESDMDDDEGSDTEEEEEAPPIEMEEAAPPVAAPVEKEEAAEKREEAPHATGEPDDRKRP